METTEHRGPCSAAAVRRLAVVSALVAAVSAEAQPEAGAAELAALLRSLYDAFLHFLSTHKLLLVLAAVVLAALAAVLVVRGTARAVGEDADDGVRAPRKPRKTQLLTLDETFAALARLLGKAGAPEGVMEAMEELGVGRVGAAERVFEEVLLRAERSSLGGQESLAESSVISANKAASEAARHLGDLASLYDLEKAVEMYRRATIMDTADPVAKNRLGRALQASGDLKEAERSHRRALELAEQSHQPRAVAESLLELGAVYVTLHQLDRGRKMLDKALEIEKDRGKASGVAACYRQMARLHEAAGEIDEAEEMLEKALDVHRQDGDRAAQASVRNRLGMLYWRQGRLDEAEKMVGKALEIFQELGRRSGTAAARGNLGLIWDQRGQEGRGEEALQEALGLYRRLGHRHGMAVAHGNLGLLYERRGELEKSRDSHRQALELHQAHVSSKGIARELYHLGRLDLKRGKPDEAEKLLVKAAELDLGMSDVLGLAMDHASLAEVYDQMGDAERARETRDHIPPDLPLEEPGARRETFTF